MAVSEFNAFLNGEKPAGKLIRELGFLKFLLYLLQADKEVLLRRIHRAINNRYTLFMKRHRNKILIPLLRTRDALDVSLFKRKMIPLHQKLKGHLESQGRGWGSHIYAGGYYYQGWSDIGIRGFRETNKRLKEYEIDNYLSPGKYALDIGCNNGFLALKIALKVKHVDAVDFNPFIVNMGREVQRVLGIKNVNFVIDDFSKMKLDKKYDLVFSLANHQTGDKNLNLSFIEHMERIHGILKEDGYLMFESHTPESKDPNFIRMIESITHLFLVEKKKRIPQYKLNYIGDRLFYVLAKKPVSKQIG